MNKKSTTSIKGRAVRKPMSPKAGVASSRITKSNNRFCKGGKLRK